LTTLVTFDEFTASARPQGGTIAELVLGEVVNVTSKRRPLMSILSSKPVSNTYVEALTDTLAARAHNAFVEGIAYTDQASTQPARHFVHTQSFYKSGRVSDEDRLVAHYNGDPFVYQTNKKLTELLNDMEHALHRGSAASGETDVARQFDGIINSFRAASTAGGTFTSSSGTTFTEEVLVDLMQVYRANSLQVDPRIAFVNYLLKRTISEFSTKTTRNIDVDRRMQILNVERHESDFGALDIVQSEDQPVAASKTVQGNTISFIDPDNFTMGVLKPPTMEVLSRDGLRDRFQINAHATLIYKSDQGGGGGEGFVSYINQS
jgi:hypothetical protein